jgi:hypothetical protein
MLVWLCGHVPAKHGTKMQQNFKVEILCTDVPLCPRKWEALVHTGVANVRHCVECGKDVTLAIGATHLEFLHAVGGCYAVTPKVLDIVLRSKRATRRKDKLRSFTDDM